MGEHFCTSANLKYSSNWVSAPCETPRLLLHFSFLAAQISLFSSMLFSPVPPFRRLPLRVARFYPFSLPLAPVRHNCDALNLAQFISSYYLYETRKRFKINTYHN
jgi:hypothetical protein